MSEQAAPNACSSTETLKNKQKLSELTLSESGKQSKGYSNQANVFITTMCTLAITSLPTQPSPFPASP